MPDVPTKESFGTCAYSHTSPHSTKLSPTTRVLNVVIGYDEALKLNMALNAALIQMSRYKFSTKSGKRAAVLLAVHLDQDRLSLHESSTKE